MAKVLYNALDDQMELEEPSAQVETQFVIPPCMNDGDYLTPVQLTLFPWKEKFYLFGRYRESTDMIQCTLVGPCGHKYKISFSDGNSPYEWKVKKHGITRGSMSSLSWLDVLVGRFISWMFNLKGEPERLNGRNLLVADGFACEDVIGIPMRMVRLSNRDRAEDTKGNRTVPCSFYGPSSPEAFCHCKLKIIVYPGHESGPWQINDASKPQSIPEQSYFDTENKSVSWQRNAKSEQKRAPEQTCVGLRDESDNWQRNSQTVSGSIFDQALDNPPRDVSWQGNATTVQQSVPEEACVNVNEVSAETIDFATSEMFVMAPKKLGNVCSRQDQRTSNHSSFSKFSESDATSMDNKHSANLKRACTRQDSRLLDHETWENKAKRDATTLANMNKVNPAKVCSTLDEMSVGHEEHKQNVKSDATTLTNTQNLNLENVGAKQESRTISHVKWGNISPSAIATSQNMSQNRVFSSQDQRSTHNRTSGEHARSDATTSAHWQNDQKPMAMARGPKQTNPPPVPPKPTKTNGEQYYYTQEYKTTIERFS